MAKYETLVKILDQIRAEGASAGYTSYAPTTDDTEAVNQARSKAYVHLFHKVKFGLLSFSDREKFITDGPQDGGVDGYFIDEDSKVITFLQSKFRTTEKNFESKQITLDEIASMDIARITSGYETNEDGVEYSGKIKGLIRNIAAIEDIGRYKYRVIIIANLRDASQTTLRNLTGGFAVEIFDSERCYSELVFPVLSGTYFQKGDLSILIDVSNKSAGARVTYGVSTVYGDCDITVLFVATLEIAKIMYRYKNAILKYNPRSYLEFEGAPVNLAIRESILSSSSNEFALLNNGITMISDQTNISERIGQKNKAQLVVTNPQIINGGQTAYTLSRILESDAANVEAIFGGKEVLLKVITLNAPEQSYNSEKSKQLIDKISTATNRQTAVTNTDRYSNEEGFLVLQKAIFDRFGVLFERKRGEFGDGVRDGYLDRDQILERNVFAKIFFAANGRIPDGGVRRSFLRLINPEEIATRSHELDRFYFCYRAYLSLGRPALNKRNRATVMRLYAFTSVFFSRGLDAAEKTGNIEAFHREWESFLSVRSAAPKPSRSVRKQRALEGEGVPPDNPNLTPHKSIKDEIDEYFASSPLHPSNLDT